MKITINIPRVRKLPNGMSKDAFLALLMDGVGLAIGEFETPADSMEKEKAVLKLLETANVL